MPDEPVFPPNEVHRHVQSRLAEIEQDRSTPARRAMLQLVRTIFDPADRASRPCRGSPETVARVDSAAIAAFHGDHLRADGATSSCPGAARRSHLGRRRHPRRLAGCARSGRHRDHCAGGAADRARIVVVDRPGSVQAELLVAAPGPDRRTPMGWAAYPVLSFLVGGSPSARVDAVLREEKGYTYGIRSGFRPGGWAACSSPPARCAPMSPCLRSSCSWASSTVRGTASPRRRPGAGRLRRQDRPGRYATADAIADEAATMAMDGLTTDFTTELLGRFGR